MKERIGCIYLLRNLVNGKGYVGQTNRFTKRCAEHVSAALAGGVYPLYKSMRKHGVDNFSAEVLWKGPICELNAKESFYITKFDTFAKDGRGYNLTLGGDGRRGYKLSVTARKKIGEARKTYFAKSGNSELQSARLLQLHEDNPDLRWKCGAAVKMAHKLDPTISKRQSKAAKKRYKNQAEREKAGRARRGVTVSQETKNRIAASLVGRRHSAATIAKRAKSNTGRRRSPESCARIAAGIARAKLERKLASAEAAQAQ